MRNARRYIINIDKLGALIEKFKRKKMGRRSEWIIIGISGVTCGGKTTLSNKMTQSMADIFVLHQDKYFLPDDHPGHVPVPHLTPPHNNYDILSALNMKQMYRDALAIMEGSEELAHGRNSGRRAGMMAVPGRKILVLEGFTTLNYKPIYDLCDIRYYFILEYGECFARRVHRLYDPPDVAGYFESCVWPEHLRYRAELEHDPNITIIDGKRTDTFEQVVHDLARFGATEITD